MHEGKENLLRMFMKKNNFIDTLLLTRNILSAAIKIL